MVNLVSILMMRSRARNVTEKSFKLVMRILSSSVQKKVWEYKISLSELAKYFVSIPLETMKVCM